MSEAVPTRRPWWKLHFSTKVVIAMVVLGLVLANVPGQQVMRVDVPNQMSNYGPHFTPYAYYEHGWPVRYLSRWGIQTGASAPRWTSCWQVTEKVTDFSPFRMVLNFCICTLLVGLAATIFEVWRRRRQSLVRFRLSELFGVITLVAMGSGWVQYKIRLANDERVALREAAANYRTRNPGNTLTEEVEYEHGGPTFLREFAPNHDPFILLDHVVSADVVDQNPRFTDRLPHLKCVTAGGFDEEGARAVATLQELEGLNSNMGGLGDLSRYSPLRRLRGINLYESEVTERDVEWLGRCTNLEQIEMRGVNIGDEGLRKLCSLKRLKALSVGGGYEGPKFTDGCFELLSQLDSLEELELSGNFQGRTVEALLRLKKLKYLRVSSPNIGSATMKRLENFGHLTWLSISGNISDEDVSRLQAAIPKCEVNSFGRP